MRPIKYLNDDGNFHFVIPAVAEGAVSSVTEIRGDTSVTGTYETKVANATSEQAALVAECYAGPDDPRLPKNVATLRVGEREDWVDKFNTCFYLYDKSEDSSYDPDRPVDVNRVEYATRMADEGIYNDDADDEYSDSDEVVEANQDENKQEDNVTRIRETFVGGVPFEAFEETRDGYTNEITVIEQGWSLNGNYYGQNAINQVAEGAAGYVVGYFNHGETFNRDPRDWAIVTESGRVEGSKVKSRIHIFKHPDGAFLEERISYAKRKKANHLFGVSIDAFAQVTEGEAEGRDGVIVEKILKLNSVDIVMVPAAKGRFDARESVQDTTEQTKTEDIMDVKTLREEHPDTAKLIEDEVRAEEASMHTELVVQKDGEIATLHEEINSTKAELAKAQAQVDEYVEAEKRIQFADNVRTLVAEGLDEEKRSERFEKILLGLGEGNLDTIKEMIADRQESVVTAVITGEGAPSAVIEAVEDKAEEVVEEVQDATSRLEAFKANLKG